MTLSDYSRGEQDGRSLFKKTILFVCLVSLVYRVSLVQPNKRDKPNKPEQPADFTAIESAAREKARPWTRQPQGSGSEKTDFPNSTLDLLLRLR